MVIVIIIGLLAIGYIVFAGGPNKAQPPRRKTHRKTHNSPYRKTPPAKSLSRSERQSGQYKRPDLPASRELSGKCYVIDGDTIAINRVKIRLAGIDAPELHQAYGQKSKWAMVNICKGQIVTAKLNGEFSYDRLVGTCYLPDGRDIGAELITQGLAVDYVAYSGGKYRNLEPRGSRQKLRRPPYDR